MCCWSPRSLECTAREGQPRNGARTPRQVVVDEGVGFLFAVAFLPPSAGTVIAGFFVFRAFDIVKPPPARQLEALPRGWGIVADDVVAGLYSNLVIRSSSYLVEWAG